MYLLTRRALVEDCKICNGEGFIVIEELKSKKQYLDDDDD